jgi:hypothetical protein
MERDEEDDEVRMRMYDLGKLDYTRVKNPVETPSRIAQRGIFESNQRIRSDANMSTQTFQLKHLVNRNASVREYVERMQSLQLWMPLFIAVKFVRVLQNRCPATSVTVREALPC